MNRRFLQAFAAAAAVCAFFAPTALAAGTKCHTTPPCASAVCIYTDQGQTPSSGACPKKPAHHQSPAPSQQPTYVQTSTTVTPTAPRNPTHKTQTHRKPHKQVTKPKPASSPVKLTRIASDVKPPSAAAAAFDLGSGPTALFAVLLAVAALLAIGGGLHRGRRR